MTIKVSSKDFRMQEGDAVDRKKWPTKELLSIRKRLAK
jgi:hypothetical protein